MEKTWFSFQLCLIISLFQLCNGLPIPSEKAIATTDSGLQLVSSLIAVCLTLCTLVFIAGCLCCYGKNGFKEFRDTPIILSGNTGVDNGLVNPTADGAFTIFSPISQNLAESNKFLLDENYVYGDINVSSWFNESERDFPRSKLKYIRELGRGWFGKVVQGTAQNIENIEEDDDKNAWTPVVVRILDSTASTKERVYFLNQVNIYKCGEHTNILKLYGKCLDSVPYLLLQEYCPQGDLKTYLISNKTSSSSSLLASEYPLIWCCQLTSALKFLHDFGLAHSDLACRNCQLSSNLTLKLGDYGLAPLKYPEDYYEGSGVDQISTISVRWCAPESIKYTSSTIQSEQVTREANIWSLGVCFWEICECGSRPYEESTDDEVISNVHGKSNLRLSRPSNAVLYTDYIYRLMQSCWSTPESRPTANQIYPTLTDLLQVFTQFKTENTQQQITQESFDSRWNSLKPNTATQNEHEWIKFNVSEPESFDDFKMHRSSSSETEDENWKTKIERGAYSEKVRQKSRSVTDLMILTHIDCSESDTETPFQSLTDNNKTSSTPGVQYKNVRLAPKQLDKMSLVHGSEGNLLNVEDDFEIELKKLHEEHKDSLVFQPDTDGNNTSRLNERLKELSSTTSEIEPKNQIFNVFNVKINTNLSPVHVTLNEIINLNEEEQAESTHVPTNYEVPKLCDIIENNSNVQIITEEKYINDDCNDIQTKSTGNSENVEGFHGKFERLSTVEKVETDVKLRNAGFDTFSPTEMLNEQHVDLNLKKNVEATEACPELDKEQIEIDGNSSKIEETRGENEEMLQISRENSGVPEIRIELNGNSEEIDEKSSNLEILENVEIIGTNIESNEFNRQIYVEESERAENADKENHERTEVLIEVMNLEKSVPNVQKIPTKYGNIEETQLFVKSPKDQIETYEKPNSEIQKSFDKISSNHDEENENFEKNIELESVEKSHQAKKIDSDENAKLNKYESEDLRSNELIKPEIIKTLESSMNISKMDLEFHENLEERNDQLLNRKTEESNSSEEKKNTENLTERAEDITKITLHKIENVKNSSIIEKPAEQENVPEKKTESNAITACQSEKLYQVPKLIDLIENNDTLMEYIIANYESELHDNSSMGENPLLNTTISKNQQEKPLVLSEFTKQTEEVPSTSNNLDYSLETWDNFLGDAIDTQNRIGDETFTFGNLEDDQPWSFENATPPNSDVNSMEEGKFDDGIFNDINKIEKNDEDELSVDEPNNSGTWESNEGWFLHPQSNCNVAGQLTEQNEKNESYVKFGMDDEILALLRGELLAKLPHAQGNPDKKQHEEIYETNVEEDEELFLKYKIYNTPLSPIPEENEDGIDENDESESCATPGSPDSGASDDWPEKFFQKQQHHEGDDDYDDENDNSQSVKTQDLQQMFHQSSQDSCCSNDTLFNFEDMTMCAIDDHVKNESISPSKSPMMVENNSNKDEGDEETNFEFINEADYVNINPANITFDVVENENKDQSDEGTLEEQDEMFKVLTDIRFSGPCGESHLMSTSFSESNNEQDWDSGSDTRSTSSSGEFIWKEGEHEESLKALKALPQDTDDRTCEIKDEKRVLESSGESNCSDEEGECPEFIPSAWDKHALPTKSAMRSPEKTLEREEKKKGVWFKKQRYHCVYEYPKEPESPVLQSFDLWNNPPPVTSYPDWYFDIDSTDEFKSFHSKPDTDFSTTGFNEEFFVTSSSTPFDMMMGRGGSSSSQFFPGLNTTGKLDENNTTPDSGVDDLTSSSTPPDTYDMKPFLMLPTLKNLAENAYKKFQQKQDKNEVNNAEKRIEILGGLRHTRDKLKLDLPLSPNTFSATLKNQFNFETNGDRPSFTTFGKSRFSVQQIDDDDIKGKNVCFEALPHKPPMTSCEIKNTKKNEEKGEANVLDSADEDSGIESSTLERKPDVDILDKQQNVVEP